MYLRRKGLILALALALATPMGAQRACAGNEANFVLYDHLTAAIPLQRSPASRL